MSLLNLKNTLKINDDLTTCCEQKMKNSEISEKIKENSQNFSF
jgi:hypothetical protein